MCLYKSFVGTLRGGTLNKYQSIEVSKIPRRKSYQHKGYTAYEFNKYQRLRREETIQVQFIGPSSPPPSSTLALNGNKSLQDPFLVHVGLV